MGAHLIAEHLIEIGKHFRLVLRPEHVERLAVDMFDLDEFQARINLFGMYIEMTFKICDPVHAQSVEEGFDAAVILLPQRDGSIFKQTFEMVTRHGISP